MRSTSDFSSLLLDVGGLIGTNVWWRNIQQNIEIIKDVDSNHHRWRWWFKSANQQALRALRAFSECSVSTSFHHPTDGYESIPINTIFRGMNIQKSQLFWCEQKGYYWFWHTARSEIRSQHVPAPNAPVLEQLQFRDDDDAWSFPLQAWSCWSMSQSNEYTQWIIPGIVSGSETWLIIWLLYGYYMVNDG